MMSSPDDEDLDAAELSEDFNDLRTIRREADKEFYLDVAYPIFQAIRWAGKNGHGRFRLTVKVRVKSKHPCKAWRGHHVVDLSFLL